VRLLGGILGAVEYVFPCGKILKLARSAVNITESKNPIILAKNVTYIVIDCCTPLPIRPPLKLALKCLAAGASLGVTLVQPNPTSAGAAVHFILDLYEEC